MGGVSASIGRESGFAELRKAGSIWVGKGSLSALSIYEKGGSGYWYKHLATAKIYKDNVAVGVFSKRFFGTGPYLQVKAGNLTLWGTVVQNKGLIQELFGLKFTY